MSENQAEAGRRLLSAVERILDDTDALIALVDRLDSETPRAAIDDDDAHRRAVAERIVSHFSKRSALSGGATALPALLPGVGTVVAGLGGTLADMGLMLKFEVEMALCLARLYGFDIHDPKERSIAFLLASVSTYEARTERHVVADLAVAEGEAIWKYTPRELSKVLLTAMTKLALVGASRGFAKLVPFVGVVVGVAANKVLTGRVGKRCIQELERRCADEAEASEEPPVQARVRKDGAPKTRPAPKAGARKAGAAARKAADTARPARKKAADTARPARKKAADTARLARKKAARRGGAA